MTDITANIVLDSISSAGVRIITYHLRYPLMVHAELMTHRDFSRNARSSRAVPIERMIQEAIDNPMVPLFWGKNQKGMQAGEDLSAYEKELAIDRWMAALHHAVTHARYMSDLGLHKQIANRLLAPFLHIDTLVTSTKWANWFALRDHKDAEPHIELLAKRMFEAREASTPKEVGLWGWHLPYVTDEERSSMPMAVCHKLSVARCARISYAPFDGDPSIGRELERYDLLMGSQPVHASPTEHQATPDTYRLTDVPGGVERLWNCPQQHGNLHGWRQLRKMLPNEYVKEAA